MVGRQPLRGFIENDRAVSEEFTSLPALSVVMIGFALFILLISNTYNAYEIRIDSIEKYKTADFIATKLTNPDCFFMDEGGVVNISLLETSESLNELNSIRNTYKTSGIDFIIRISWDSTSEDYPENLPNYVGDRVAVSRSISVYLNPAQTRPGRLTVITWSV
jgi:hypothetical protein